MKRIYVAGKWQDRKTISEIMTNMLSLGHKITCDWTDHEYPTENIEAKLMDYAIADIQGVIDCEVFIFYAVKFFDYRGALVEMGAALALGKPVYIIGKAINGCIFINHPLVTMLDSLEQFRQIQQSMFNNRTKGDFMNKFLAE